MKKSRFSESQIISILKQAEAGTPVPELCGNDRTHAWQRLQMFKGRIARQHFLCSLFDVCP